MYPLTDKNDPQLDFVSWLAFNGIELPPSSIDTLWLNITRQCNQACRHCHVEGSPESMLHMSDDVLDACLRVLKTGFIAVDITGGTPEMHPRFEYMVKTIRSMGKRVVVRHNLTVTIDGDPLSGKTKNHLPAFFARNQVEIIASLPSWKADLTDSVRGPGVFGKSVDALRLLMEAGYATDPDLKLKLVSNYDGPMKPEDRTRIEIDFKTALNNYGIIFDELLTVTNMPVGRFGAALRREGRYSEYLMSLKKEFNEAAAQAAVCRELVSVGIDGRLYDCDFNQALGIPIGETEASTIFDFNSERLLTRRIKFGDHCFGCTAGAGSG